MIPSVIKCSKCRWTKVADYDGFSSKDAAIKWADQLHQQESPDCTHRFKKVEFMVIPRGEDPQEFAQKVAAR